MNDRTTDERKEEFVGDIADRVSSGEEFLEVLKQLVEKEETFSEFGERSATEFVTVIHEKLEFAREFPSPEDIEFPDEPDWNWLARLFMVGAFDN